MEGGDFILDKKKCLDTMSNMKRYKYDENIHQIPIDP
jgi:hypothetical protein